MVNIVENWAEITGEIVSVTEDLSKPENQLVKLRILSNNNHLAFPNLVKPDKDEEITLKIKKHELKNKPLKPGKVIKATIRAAPANIYFADMGSIKIVKKDE